VTASGPVLDRFIATSPLASRREDRKSMTVINQMTGERFAVIDQIVLGMGRNTAQMVFTIGSIAIITKRRGCVLSLPRALADAQRNKLLGAMLDRAVDHPIFAGRCLSKHGGPAADECLHGRVEV
jgi:hypothetical protein